LTQSQYVALIGTGGKYSESNETNVSLTPGNASYVYVSTFTGSDNFSKSSETIAPELNAQDTQKDYAFVAHEEHGVYGNSTTSGNINGFTYGAYFNSTNGDTVTVLWGWKGDYVVTYFGSDYGEGSEPLPSALATVIASDLP
jgi:hypothetical protein